MARHWSYMLCKPNIVKPIATLLIIGVLSFPVTSFSHHEEVATEVVPSKHKNLFVMKLDRDMLGAKVEVFYSNGDLVSQQTISRRKVIIDFCDVKFGSYRIVVSKNEDKQEYFYLKK